MMKEYDFSLKACLESVEWYVEHGANPFEELGRSIIRGEQDVFYNKTMTEAWLEFIRRNGTRWDEPRQ